MLRVDPVADREEGLWPAARDVHGAWPRPQKKARTDRKSLVKYVDENSLLIIPPQEHARKQEGVHRID